jgi:hypothetical protein
MRWPLSLAVVDLRTEDAEQTALVRGHANGHVSLGGKPCWDTKPYTCRCPDLLTSSARIGFFALPPVFSNTQQASGINLNIAQHV